MRTECKQVRFEFHQLSQRKVKARFDFVKSGCAVDRTHVEELLGQRIYGLCLGYEDLNDHDQLRTDPMLAVAVNKADPLGEPAAGLRSGEGAGGQVYAEPVGVDRRRGR